MDAAELLERYLSGKSEGSRKVYRSEIARFLAFLESRARTVDRVTAADLDAYHQHQSAKGLKNASLKRSFSMIKSFLALVEKSAGDFQSPVSERGALKRYQAPSYAEGELKGLLPKFEKSLSKKPENTRKTYVGAVHRFFKAMGKPPEEIRFDDMIEWRDSLYSKGIKTSTIQLYLISLGRFSAFAKKHDAAIVRPDFIRIRDLELEKEGGRQEPFSKKEMDELFKAAGNLAGVIAMRDKAILSLAYAFGLRVGEIRQAKASDLSQRYNAEQKRHEWTLTLYGRKHRRHKTFDLILPRNGENDRLIDAVKAWHKEAGTNAKRGDPMICRVRWDNRDNLYKSLPGKPLSPRQIGNRFVKWVKAAGIDIGAAADGRGEPRRIVVHTLRHTRATRLYRSGAMDLVELREFFGHQNIRTLDGYLHLKF